MAVQVLRHLRPLRGGQRDLPIDTRRLAASVTLRDLPHADQRVGAAAQHQLLQIADPLEVPVPRRLEDPSPKSPYVLLLGAPIDGLPVQGVVCRSVHHDNTDRGHSRSLRRHDA